MSATRSSTREEGEIVSGRSRSPERNPAERGRSPRRASPARGPPTRDCQWRRIHRRDVSDAWVSDKGQVWDGHKFLEPFKSNNTGYWMVKLAPGTCTPVHVLVAHAYAGRCAGRWANHISKNFDDNSASNVCWVDKPLRLQPPAPEPLPPAYEPSSGSSAKDALSAAQRDLEQAAERVAAAQQLAKQEEEERQAELNRQAEFTRILAAQQEMLGKVEDIHRSVEHLRASTFSLLSRQERMQMVLRMWESTAGIGIVCHDLLAELFAEEFPGLPHARRIVEN